MSPDGKQQHHLWCAHIVAAAAAQQVAAAVAAGALCRRPRCHDHDLLDEQCSLLLFSVVF
jgi:hypothetical protein